MSRFLDTLSVVILFIIIFGSFVFSVFRNIAIGFGL